MAEKNEEDQNQTFEKKKRGRPKKVVEPEVKPAVEQGKRAPRREKLLKPKNTWKDDTQLAKDLIPESRKNSKGRKPNDRQTREPFQLVPTTCNRCNRGYQVAADLITESGYTCDRCIGGMLPRG